MEPINGLVAAVHTPLDERGAVQTSVVESQAEHLAAQPVVGVYVCGSTGESLSLSVNERRAVLEAWADARRTGQLLIAHVGANALDDCRELARHAAECGVDAVSAMHPTFARPRVVEDLVAFHARIAEAAEDRPYLLYDFAAMGGPGFPSSRVLREARTRIPNLSGVKFTAGDLHELQLTLDLAESHDLQVLFGHDELLLAGLALGCRGAIGSTYNYAAPLYAPLLEAFARGDLSEARALQRRSARLVETLLDFGVLRTGKALVEQLGIRVGPPKPPERRLDATELAEVMTRIAPLEIPGLGG